MMKYHYSRCIAPKQQWIVKISAAVGLFMVVHAIFRKTDDNDVENNGSDASFCPILQQHWATYDIVISGNACINDLFEFKFSLFVHAMP